MSELVGIVIGLVIFGIVINKLTEDDEGVGGLVRLVNWFKSR